MSDDKKDILTAIFGESQIPKKTIELTEREQIEKLMKCHGEMNRARIAPGTLLQEVSFAGFFVEAYKHKPVMFVRYMDPETDSWSKCYELLNVLRLKECDLLDCVVMFYTPSGKLTYWPHNSALLVPFKADPGKEPSPLKVVA